MNVLLVNKIENIMLKVELAYHEQFILLPQCDQNLSAADDFFSIETLWENDDYSKRAISAICNDVFSSPCLYSSKLTDVKIIFSYLFKQLILKILFYHAIARLS